MMHAAGGARLALKSQLRGLVTDKTLAENLDSHRAFDEQMRGAINRSHPTAAEAFVQAILAVECLAYQRVKRNVGNRRICLKRGEIVRTDVYIIGKLPAASWALKHFLFRRQATVNGGTDSLQ